MSQMDLKGINREERGKKESGWHLLRAVAQCTKRLGAGGCKEGSYQLYRTVGWGYQILGMSQIKAKKIIWKKDFVLDSVSNWCYLVR